MGVEAPGKNKLYLHVCTYVANQQTYTDEICLSHINIHQHVSVAFLNIITVLYIDSFIHSFIPLACAEFDDSMPFSGATSIPLCYVLFPTTLPSRNS